MSVEDAKKYIDKLKSDGDFSHQLNEVKTNEARLEIAKAANLEFTAEEYKAATSKLPVWTMDEWLAARRAYDSYETSWLAHEFNPWK